jgi:phenylpropionate dioxygenase-like ring-hydroxylating dioxygenase large terminal subunit
MVREQMEYVDSERGLLDRRMFVDPDVYQQELENIFGRAWLLIGHDSLVPNPNDFFLTYMGEDPVILTRDAKGEVHAFLNMCMHRGNRVARADDGNAKNFMCTYHGWTYSNEGKLVSVPGLQEAYYGELDVDKLGLVSVAQIDTYAGLIFATWDAQAPSLEDYLGDQRWYLDIMFNRREGGVEFLGPEKWIIPCNWKFPTDNFAGDTYHFPLTHISALTAQVQALGMKSFDVQGYFNTPGGKGIDTGNGNGLMSIWPETEEEYWGAIQAQYHPTLVEYQRQIKPEMERRLGIRGKKAVWVIGDIFPNVAYHLPNQLLRIWFPRGPLHTEVWSWVVVDKEASEEVKRISRSTSVQAFGVSGIYEQDDMDNWRQCTESGLTFRGKGVKQILSLGKGHDIKDEVLPGSVAGHWINETPQRQVYRRWQEFMSAGSWSDIHLDPHTAKYEGTATFKG